MKWLGSVLLGPALWALVFGLVYALHGALHSVPTVDGSGRAARLSLALVWVIGLLAFLPLLRAFPAQPGLRARLPRAGVWIGFGATAFTLFPLVVTTAF